MQKTVRTHSSLFSVIKTMVRLGVFSMLWGVSFTVTPRGEWMVSMNLAWANSQGGNGNSNLSGGSSVVVENGPAGGVSEPTGGAAVASPQVPTPPPPPPPQNCTAKTFSLNLPDRRITDVYSFAVPALNHGVEHKVDCVSVPVIDGHEYKSGQIKTLCDNGVLQAPEISCVSENVEAQCDLSIRKQVTKEQLVTLHGSDSAAQELFRDLPSGVALSQVVEVIPFCKMNREKAGSISLASRARYSVENLPKCSSSIQSGICYLDPLSLVSSSYTLQFQITGEYSSLKNSSGGDVESRLFLWNKSQDQDRSTNVGDIKFHFQWRLANQWKSEQFTSLDAVSISSSPTEPSACRLTVSGTISSYTETNPPKVKVTNDVLVFTPVLLGGEGGNSNVEISFAGGPSATGVWGSAPAGVESTVTANIKTASGKQFSCSLTVIPQARAAAVRLRGYSDCAYFNALRTYYFLDPSGRGYQTSPLNLRLPGSDAIYGQRSPEVPFAGMLNVAAAFNREIVMTANGKVTMPPVDKRAYSKIVIVARKFDPKAPHSVGNALFYGLVDPNDYAVTQMFKIGNASASAEESIVFQAYLAAAQVQNMRDFRGSNQAGFLQYYEFASATQNGMPYDKLIPFVNESCTSIFQISPPVRSDKPLPNELKSVSQCLFSRPFKVADLNSGRVDLSLVYITPEHPNHQFPAQLLKASNKPTCVAKNPSNQRDCWQISASSLGINAQTNPYSSNLQCREERTVYVSQTVSSTVNVCSPSGNSYSCSSQTRTSTVQVPQTVVTFKASCPVLESNNECSKNLALRFTGYNMQMIAALGCAAKYNRPGELVTATLPNQGVLPYTPALGGSNPRLFTAYPSSYGQRLGYSCIPCRFQSDAIAAGVDLAADTAPLPVDQDSTTRRKPIFSFNRIKAPAECVENMNFEVRYFGSKECDGVSNPPGHFCSSENLGGQNCPANSEGGGNVAGRFSIPVCPGAGFEYENLSVSWSPIIVDVFGNGIEISRRTDMAVFFDIKGRGEKALIDWPVNTNEVAFLVLPNKLGQVQSVKELFGDDKFANGFEKLKSFDKNRDQLIDAKDKVYAQLRLWFDRNRNGMAEPDELESLAAHGVQILYLDYFKRSQRGTEGKTLYSVYYNNIFNSYLNYGDYYFQAYKRK